MADASLPVVRARVELRSPPICATWHPWSSHIEDRTVHDFTTNPSRHFEPGERVRVGAIRNLADRLARRDSNRDGTLVRLTASPAWAWVDLDRAGRRPARRVMIETSVLQEVPRG